MSKIKKGIVIRRPTQTQLRFVWNVIHNLQDFVTDMMEKGGKRLSKSYNDSVKAKRIVQQQRLFNYKSKNIKKRKP